MAKTLTSVRYPPELLARVDKIAEVRGTDAHPGKRTTRTEILLAALDLGLRQIEFETGIKTTTVEG